MRSGWFALLLVAVLSASARLGAQAPVDRFAAVQASLDDGDAEGALAQLAKLPAKGKEEGRFLLLRSTAELMLGQEEAGRKDLARALEIDPALRQGWLNRGALEIAGEHYEAALEAFRQAEKLDPAAADNHLNIGAVELLRGNPGGAAERFRRYLAANPSAEGYYLVASNYASAGQAAPAAEHLKRAVELDERMRVAARSDANFLPLFDSLPFKALMNGEPATPPADHYSASRTFPEAYRGAGSKLLTAVLSAVQLSKEPYDPRVEVTDAWALLWGELRIVVRSSPEGEGLVELSASPEQMPLSAWSTRSEALFRAIGKQLLVGGKLPPSEPAP